MALVPKRDSFGFVPARSDTGGNEKVETRLRAIRLKNHSSDRY